MDDPTLAGGNLPTPALERLLLETPPAIYDEADEFALVRCLTGKLKEAVLAVPPEFREKTDKELVDFAELELTRIDYALRASFWREYGRAMSLGLTTLDPKRIFAGVCTGDHFLRILKQPGRVAWLVLPQQAYKVEMEAILGRATSRLWELMEMDVSDPKHPKRICPRRADLLLKVITMVNDRVKGMAVQRVEKKSATVKVTDTTVRNSALPAPSIDELRARLAQLQETPIGQDRGQGSPGDGQALPLDAPKEERTVIDVTPVRSAPDDVG